MTAGRGIPVLFVASGAVALVYQLVWARWAGLVLGRFAPAVATVTATFMAGLAVGSLLFGRIAARSTPAGALRLWALLEGGLALAAAASPVMVTDAGQRLADLLPRPVWCALVLLPPTILMGGTLPVIVRAAGAATPAAVARLYALNTAGAAMGPLLAAFWAMPGIGIGATLWLACGINLLIAIAAWRMSKDAPDSPPSSASTIGADIPVADRLAPALPALPLLLAAASGALALGFEVALTRLVTLTISRTSVYGFAIVLSAFLFGLAAGAAACHRRPPGGSGGLLAFAGSQTVAWAWTLAALAGWDALVPGLAAAWRQLEGFGGRALFDGTVTTAVLLPLPAAFGYALPALCASLPRVDAAAVGRLTAANTTGAILGALAAGFVLLPRLGLTRTLLGLGALSLALAAAAAWAARPRWRAAIPLGFAVALAPGAFISSPDPRVMNAGLNLRPDLAILNAAVVMEEDGLTGRVSVMSRAPGHLAFSIDGAPNASNSPTDVVTQVLLAWLPLLAADQPRRMLVIGLGAGITAGSASGSPGLEELRIVEIEPAQPRVAAVFRASNHDVLHHPAVRLTFDDGRRYLRASADRFDAVSNDPADLFVSGMANLYTRESHRLVRARLAEGGAFVQYLHAYHLRADDLRGLLATTQSVFPHTSVWVQPHGDFLVLATDRELRIDPAAWERRLREGGAAADLAAAGIAPASDIAGLFLWNAAEVARYAGNARLVTDADPFTEFTISRVPFTRTGQNRLGRDVALFGPLTPAPLVREDAATRLRLARLAFGHGLLSRARAEATRALALSPGKREALTLLDRIDALASTAVP